MPNNGGTRVPLIVSVPGGEGGRVFDDLIDFTDFLPTLADAAGLTIPDVNMLDGVSFLDRLQGRTGQPREWIYTYYFPRPFADRFDNPQRHPEASYVRDKRYQLYGTGEFFDISVDPHQVHPLPSDDEESSAARTKLQAVLDSMPGRGEEIYPYLIGTVPDSEPRPRWRPVLSKATVNGGQLTLTYAGILDSREAPPADSFIVNVDGSERAVSTVSISKTAVTLTLASAVTVGQTVTLNYTPGTNAIQHANTPFGHKAAPLVRQGVTNNTVDTTAPAVLSITSDATHPTKNAFTVTITFSEEVRGLTAGEIAVTNGTGSNFAGTGASYMLDIEPSDDIEADVTVRVPADAAMDAANLGNIEGIETFAVDTQAPAVLSITSDATHPTKDAFRVTITFSEAVTELTSQDIAVMNGVGSNFAGTDARYTLDIEPSANTEDDVTVRVRANAAVDGVNIGNVEGIETFAVDTQVPRVLSITSDAAHPTKDTFTVTITFSEEVTGLTASEIVVSNGRGSNFAGTGARYTLDIAPNANLEADVTVRVRANAAVDGANNSHVDEGETFAVDTRAPVLMSAAVDGDTLTLSYGEALGNPTPEPGDFTMNVESAGRSVSRVAVSGRAVTLTLASAVAHGETVRVSYSPGTNPIQDAVGNQALGLSNASATNTTDAPNTDPMITSPGPFNVTENQARVTRLMAADADPGDEVTGYTLVGGADRAQFTVGEDTGDLGFLAVPNFEAPTDAFSNDPPSGAGDNEYIVVVQVSSGAGTRVRTAEQTIRVRVSDVDELPAAPEEPTFPRATPDSLTVAWTEPDNTGPPITGYDVQYREGVSGGFTDAPHSGTAQTTTLMGLSEGTAYQVQVRARNAEGTGDWSEPGEGRTVAPLRVRMTPELEPPVEGPFSVRFSFSETVTGFSGSDIETGQDLACMDDQNNPVFCNPGFAAFETTDSRVFTTRVTPRTGGVANNYKLTLTVRAGGVRSSVGNKPNEEATLEVPVAPPGVTVPIGPLGLTASGGNGQVALRWNAPGDTGGAAMVRYEYRVADGVGGEFGAWMRVDAAARSAPVPDLTNGREYVFELRGVNALGYGGVETVRATPVRTTTGDGGGRGGGGGGGALRGTVPGAPTNLTAEGGDGQVVLSWDAPESDGGAAITDYEYWNGGSRTWTSIGSTNTTHTVTGLDNGTEYTFQVRAVNRRGRSRASNRATATPDVFILDFAHFANGASITSDLVLVNPGSIPIRPVVYFYDTGGNPINAESVVDVTGDLTVAEDGALTVLADMEPLRELTIATHGRGALVSGSVKVVSYGPVGGFLRYNVPDVGVAGVGASPPTRDVLFPARREAGGINTAAAIQNLGEAPLEVSCRLMRAGAVLEEAEIALAPNGQSSVFIDEQFPATDTSDFAGSMHCDAPATFTGVAVEMDAVHRIFTALPVVSADRLSGGSATVLDFAHFANGGSITSDLVFVNLKTRPSGPAPTPFQMAIPPSRPAIHFYDTEGNPMATESVVDITGDLEVTEDGALTVRTEMEPLGVLTISTHSRGDLVTGSVKVVSEGPIGGMLRFDLPGIGEAVVGASEPLSDFLFPVRRQEGGINTGVAIHNLESSPELVRCELLREGVLLDTVSIPLEANGQTSGFIDGRFPSVDTSDFVGLVRCDAVGEGLFSAVALELDAANRIFTTLPVIPLQETMSQE